MNSMRDRAKEHFPTVLLTLLSIVQALALELLWSHIVGSPGLYVWSWAAVVSWLQIATTLLGVVLIWVVYASTVMRFSWVPATTDSVFPFVVGVLEFMLVESLGPGALGQWFVLMAVIVGLMHWDSHHTMRRARQDSANEAFFRDVEPATLWDFRWPVAAVLALGAAGVVLGSADSPRYLAPLALAATFALLGGQLLVTARFWERSLAEDPPP